MQWLNENDDMSMEYLHNALEKDRQTGVKFLRRSFLLNTNEILYLLSFNKHRIIVHFHHLLLMYLHN